MSCRTTVPVRLLTSGFSLLLIGAVLSLAAACSPAGESEDAAASATAAVKPAPSQFGDYGPATPPFDGRTRHSLYIPMKDGVEVAIDYYLPTPAGVETTEKLPVVLHYTRYQRATEDETGKLNTAVDEDPVLQHLSSNGYVVAVADARGTGASFGVNEGAFSPAETADSHTIIEWLAAQSWSSGKVGMQGRSYPGMTQYEAATQGPPALKAIFAEMAGPTAYDFVFTNGTYKKDFVDQWGSLTKQMDLSQSTKPARVDDDADGKRRDEAVAAHAQNLWAHDILSTPDSRLRDFDGAAANGARWSWEAIDTIDDTASLEANKIAIYHLVGWYDIYTTQQPFLYEALEGRLPQKMMIGPWTHSGGYGGKVHKSEILRWYDYWLKGVENGIMDEEPVHYYVMKGNNTVPPQVASAGAAADQRRQAGDEAAGGETAPARSLDEEGAEDGSAWVATREWPPAGAATRRFSFDGGPSKTVESVNDGVLTDRGGAGWRTGAAAPAVAEGTDRYQVDYTSSMGTFSRWMNGYGSRRKEPANTAFFDERTAEDRKALTWTSPRSHRADDHRRLPRRPSGDELDAHGRRRLRLPRGGGRERRRSLRQRRRAARVAPQDRHSRLAQLRSAVSPLDRGRHSAARSRRADGARLRSRRHRDRDRRRPSDPRHSRRRRPGELRAVAGHQGQGPADHHRPSRRRSALLHRAAGGQRRDHVTFKLHSTELRVEERRR